MVLLQKWGFEEQVAAECERVLNQHKTETGLLLNKLRSDIMDEVQRLKYLHLGEQSSPSSQTEAANQPTSVVVNESPPNESQRKGTIGYLMDVRSFGF